MQEISNLLRQRLTARPAPQTHPDPDLLTAYVEHALGERERRHVVQHLAECGACREVVALSLPQEQPTQAVVRPVPARSRFWLPAFRWTAVAATMAIAAALVVEKPWKHSIPEQRVQQTSQASNPASTRTADVSPANTPEVDVTRSAPASKQATSNPAAQPTLILAEPETRAEVRRDHEAAKPQPLAAGLGQNAPADLSQTAQQPPVRVTTKSSAQTGMEAKNKDDIQRDYLNTSFLYQNEQAVNAAPPASANAAEVDGSAAGAAGTAAARLPAAPTPKAGVGGQAKSGPAAPALNADNTQNAFGITLATPQTATAAPPPEKSENNLASQAGFAARMGKKVASAVHKMAKPGGSEPSGMAFASSGADAGASGTSLNDATAIQDFKSPASQQFHWRISSQGILMKSTDLSQWHEAYPQGSELQFKTLFTLGTGRQIWAGGNNGTLVHSWNAGVNWDTLKVPEAASSDITSISIDDGWQIKTSNGQTFVSHDQGKTWVPLENN